MISVRDFIVKDDSPRDQVTVGADTVLYSRFVQRLVKDMGSNTQDILHAAVGISGEAGELLDAVKKHWAYGRELDRTNAIEELGDLEFYMTAMRLLLCVSRDEVLQYNAFKLQKRYSSGTYSDAQAQARADKAVAAEDPLPAIEHGNLLLQENPMLVRSDSRLAEPLP